MRKQLALILFLSLFSLAMSSLPQIKGKVIDSKTNLPISGAKVKLFNSSGQLNAETQTDSSGNYEVRLTLPPTASLYKLEVSKENYISQAIKRPFAR